MNELAEVERSFEMSFIDGIKERAKQDIQTIVLPEALDIRTLTATEKILKEGLANIILIGNEKEIKEKAGELKIDGAKIVDPNLFEPMEEYIETLFKLRESKGMTLEKARELLYKDPLFLGVMMVKKNYADGMVAGAVNSTANVLRPSLQILKTAPGTKIVSAFFVMSVPNCDLGQNGTFIFSDCGLNQNPSAEDLAAIAGSSAETFKLLVGEEPIIAMLSHSTKGSASHPDVDKVVEATKIAQREYPQYQIDGELQSDAALIAKVGQSKAPDSKVAGKANVLVFPDLDAGNIAYKLVQYLAKAEAYGPITQGIAAPINDLSRGATADDIVGVVSITAVQAQHHKSNK